MEQIPESLELFKVNIGKNRTDRAAAENIEKTPVVQEGTPRISKWNENAL